MTEKCERCGTLIQPFNLGELLWMFGGGSLQDRSTEWVERESTSGPGFQRIQMTTHTRARCDAARAQIVGVERFDEASMIGAGNDNVRRA